LEERWLDKPNSRHSSGRRQSRKSSSIDESNANVDVRLCRVLGIAACLVRNRPRGSRFASLPCHQERSRWLGALSAETSLAAFMHAIYEPSPRHFRAQTVEITLMLARIPSSSAHCVHSRKVHSRQGIPARHVHGKRAT
jgi:hypothetical protein